MNDQSEDSSNVGVETGALETALPFLVLEVVGQGRDGVVSRARHRVTHEPVAIKIAHARPDALANVRREIAVLNTLKHPGIVRLLAAGEHGGRPWYAMELIEGPPLLDYVCTLWPTAAHGAAGPDAAKGCIEPQILATTLGLMRRVCLALHHAHQAGVVHRDLKPSNILMRSPEEPVLVDFALADSIVSGMGALAMRGAIKGSPAFMAPEALLGSHLDARADIFGIGGILYSLLTGRPPFLTLHEVIDPDRTPAPVSSLIGPVPARLAALLQRMLEKKPEHRPAYACEVAAELAVIMDALVGGHSQGCTAAPAPRFLHRPGFHGRGEALRSLVYRVEAGLSGGQDGLLLIGGESGIGKTRLAGEIASEVWRRGAGTTRVLTGGCVPLVSSEPEAGSGPLHPLRPVLQTIVDLVRMGDLRLSKQSAGFLREISALYFPESGDRIDREASATLPGQSPDEARLRICFGLRGLLAELAPVLLVLEDVHWADDITRMLLEFHAQSGLRGPMGVVILGTYRSEEVGKGLKALLALEKVKGEHLDRLERSAVARMVEDMLGGAAGAARFVQQVASLAEGNPYYVTEYLKVVLSEGLLTWQEETGWKTVADLDDEFFWSNLPLPGNIRRVLVQQLRRLSGQARSLAEAAAVVGPEEDLSLLGYVAGLSQTELSGAASELIRCQMFEESAPGRIRFVHAKLREALLEELPESRGGVLNRATAEFLERRHRSPDGETLARLAAHWERADEPVRARPLYLAAARDACAHFAPGNARRWYEDCLRLSSSPSPERFAALLELARDVQMRSGDLAAAHETCALARAEARLLGEVQLEVRALQTLSEVLAYMARFDAAKSTCEVALTLPGERDASVEAGMMMTLGMISAFQWRILDAEAFYQRAADVLHERGNSARELEALLSLMHARAAVGLNGSLESLERVIELAQRLNDRASEAEAMWRYGGALSQRDDWTYLEQMDEAVHTLVQQGDRRWTALGLAWLARARSYFGPTEARPALREQLEQVVATMEISVMYGGLLGGLGQLRWRDGDLCGAEQVLSEGLRVFDFVQVPPMRAHLLYDLANVRADGGDPSQARQLFYEALETFQPMMPHLFMHVLTLVHLIRLLRRTDPDTAEAEALAARAIDLCDNHRLQVMKILCLCEAGHLEIARGGTGEEALLRLESHQTQVLLQPGGEPAEAITRLRRAARGARSGVPLWRGECLDDVPLGLARWLTAERHPRPGAG